MGSAFVQHKSFPQSFGQSFLQHIEALSGLTHRGLTHSMIWFGSSGHEQPKTAKRISWSWQRLRSSRHLKDGSFGVVDIFVIFELMLFRDIVKLPHVLWALVFLAIPWEALRQHGRGLAW